MKLVNGLSNLLDVFYLLIMLTVMLIIIHASISFNTSQWVLAALNELQEIGTNS